MTEGAFITGAECIECGRKYAPGPGTAKLCDACGDSRYPPILLSRGKKWSPLALGFLSLVCDVMMIPTILAIVRGFSELREVGRREVAGLYREEHGRVRTGAVWGIAIGAVRPGVIAFVAVVAVLTSTMSTRSLESRTIGQDAELDDILEYIAHDDAADRALAITHLHALAPDLADHEVEQVLVRAENGFGRSADVESALRSELVIAIGESEARAPFERLRALYSQLGRRAREAILRDALRPGTARGIDDMLELVRTERAGPDAARVEVDRLVELSAHNAHYLPPMLALPEGHTGRDAALVAALEICEGGSHIAPLQDVRTALLVYWAEVGERVDPERPRTIERASRALRLFGCVHGREVAFVLRAPSRSPHPGVAVGAVDAMLRRGDRVPRALIRRLAERVESRRDLYDALEREGQLDRMPARFRTTEMLLEASRFAAQARGPT